MFKIPVFRRMGRRDASGVKESGEELIGGEEEACKTHVKHMREEDCQTHVKHLREERGEREPKGNGGRKK